MLKKKIILNPAKINIYIFLIMRMQGDDDAERQRCTNGTNVEISFSRWFPHSRRIYSVKQRKWRLRSERVRQN